MLEQTVPQLGLHLQLIPHEDLLLLLLLSHDRLSLYPKGTRRGLLILYLFVDVEILSRINVESKYLRMLFVEVYTDSNEITFSIELFQSELVAYRPQRTGGYDAHPVAKTLGFLHLVSGQEYGPFCSAGGEHLP